MQKSNILFRYGTLAMKAWAPKELLSSVLKGSFHSSPRVEATAPFPLTVLQNINNQRLAQTSHPQHQRVVRMKVPQCLPEHTTALHNIWYQQVTKTLRPLATSVPKENVFALPYPPRRAVAGMVCGTCVRPLTNLSSSVGLYAKAESHVAALPVGGYQHCKRGMSSKAGPSVFVNDGDLGFLLESSQQSCGTRCFSSVVDPAAAILVDKGAFKPLCQQQHPMTKKRFECSSTKKPQNFSSGRFFSTQTHQRLGAARFGQAVPPFFCLLPAVSGKNSIQGRPQVLAGPIILTRQPSRMNTRMGIRPDKDHHLRILETDAAWALRLSNENVFLSWCRNTYLGSALGLAMHTAGAGLMYADVAAFMVFSLAGLNLVWGSVTYVHCLYSMGNLAQISRLSRFLQSSFALVQVLIWFYACLCYLTSWEAIFFEEGPHDA